MSPRAAGDTPHYEYHLFNKATGEYEPTEKIVLPSVTTIIGKVLAKPGIPGWYAKKMAEGVAALVEHTDFSESDLTLEEILTDPEVLLEWLKENAVHPDDIRDELAEQGKEKHEILEGLCALPTDEQQAYAATLAAGDDPFASAIGKWWVKRKPIVTASEVRLRSLRHGFAGTADLVYRAPVLGSRTLLGPLCMTDLKNRGEGKGMYDSDDAQTGLYKVAWDEMHPDNPIAKRTVLLARDNGSFNEYQAVIPIDVCLKLLDLYPWV